MKSKNIFIARTEEQSKFRQVLDSYCKNRFQRLFPTFSSLLKRPETSQPNILLLYGEGGMGKSRLIRQLKRILETEVKYRKQFNTLLIDWEQESNPELDNHQRVHPETIFSILHSNFCYHGWSKYFSEYQDLVRQIHEVENKVKQRLESSP
ncbi:MAG: ATP-binding protein, partial [Cyanobacteria bacterium P01_A01_bin.17]